MKVNKKVKKLWVEEGVKVAKGINDQNSAAGLISNMPEFIRFRTETELKHLFRKYDFSNKSVLDIGCGPGRLSIEMGRRSKCLVGIDLSSDFVDLAKQNALINDLDNVDFYCTDLYELGLNQKFDIVFIGGVLLYFTDDEINEVLLYLKDRYLKPGADIIIREPMSYLGKREETNIDIKRTKLEYEAIFNSAGFQLSYSKETFIHCPPFKYYTSLSSEKRNKKLIVIFFRILFTINGKLDWFFQQLGPSYVNNVSKNWTIKQNYMFFSLDEK